MAEWKSNSTYATRVQNITNGGGLNGSFKLDSTTVIDDNAIDTLFGGAGDLDLFYIGKRDKLEDWVNGETRYRL